MSERRSRLRRKPLTDRTNTGLLDSSPKPKPKPSPKPKPTLSEPLQRQNPSDDPPHSPTPPPNQLRVRDDADCSFLEISKTYTRSSAGKIRERETAVAVSISPSCSPPRAFKSSRDKVEEQQEDVKKKKVLTWTDPQGGGRTPISVVYQWQLTSMKPRIKEDSMRQEFIDKQRAYFADIDAFELPVEVASESELD